MVAILCTAGILYEHPALTKALQNLVVEGDGDQGGACVDPRWLVDLLLAFHPGELASYRIPASGILTQEQLCQAWRPPMFPEKIHPALLEILQSLRFLFTIPSEGMCERFRDCLFNKGRGRVESLSQSEARVILPHLLSEQQPTEILQGLLPKEALHAISVILRSRLPDTFGRFMVCVVFYYNQFAHSFPGCLPGSGSLSTTIFVENWNSPRTSQSILFAFGIVLRRY